MSTHEHQRGNCHCHPHGTAVLEGGAIETCLEGCEGWQLKDGHLVKTYRFPDADAALAFFRRVGSTGADATITTPTPAGGNAKCIWSFGLTRVTAWTELDFAFAAPPATPTRGGLSMDGKIRLLAFGGTKKDPSAHSEPTFSAGSPLQRRRPARSHFATITPALAKRSLRLAVNGAYAPAGRPGRSRGRGRPDPTRGGG